MKTYSDWEWKILGEDSISVGWPITAKPIIIDNHIDGPVIHFRDGQMHWLTIWERIQYSFGKLDADILERKLRPNLMKLVDANERYVIRKRNEREN